MLLDCACQVFEEKYPVSEEQTQTHPLYNNSWTFLTKL